LFAGGTAIKDYVISILPGDGLAPPGIGEKVVTASTKTVFKVPICDMSNSNCSLKDMPLHQWTAVKPGVAENGHLQMVDSLRSQTWQWKIPLQIEVYSWASQVEIGHFPASHV
jgi:hypothetical protein